VAIFRTFSEIVNSIIERLRLTQPNLDTKPGTVARDLFIDVQADQLQRLHSSMLTVSQKQSPELATGKDLDRWANNFGITRRTGAPANGIVVFTVNNLNTDISIPANTVVTTRGNLQYKTIGNFVMSVAEKNRFAATATRLRSSLDLAGINDSFAIEIPVRAINSGTTGNISSLQVIEHNLRDSVRVTNLTSFNGGTNTESDSVFRARVFSVFSGANTGTAFGYRNAALGVTGVNDAIIIEPGNTLMLRDGTETIQVNDGSFRILNSGTGGKVDLYILGQQLEEIVESYIFTDRSGTGNASDERNDYILGQSTLDTTLTSEERRVLAFNNGILPQQPATAVISVIGSESGVLAEKLVDQNGIVSGNYELIKDTNPETGGSPFGFDKIRFISSEKQVVNESIIKQSLNSVDPLRFSSIKIVNNVYQDISVNAENSKVNSVDRTIIKLNHSPVVTVSRVLNKTTGEVYVVEDQNLDPDAAINLTGEIVISGKTLPSPSDILSVNYIWRLYFDKYIDYNGKYTGAQFVDQFVNDSIDWGTSNGIKAEVSVIEKTNDGLEYQVSVSNDISRITSLYSAITATGTVQLVQGIGGMLVNGVVLPSTEVNITNIISVKNETGVELYNTIKNDGSFSGKTIYLPSDSPVGSSINATVFYNKLELYTISNGDGAFSNNIITLPSSDILTTNAILDEVDSLYLTGEPIYVDYIAQISELLPSNSLTLLPINGTSLSNRLFNNTLSELSGSNQPVFYNISNAGTILGTQRFGPTRLSITISSVTRAGKIKVNGETLTRLQLEVVAGTSISGLQFDLTSAIKFALSLTTFPATFGIARVDNIESIDDSSKKFDLMGHVLSNNTYGLGVVELDTTLSPTKFKLPATANNNALSFSSGEKVVVDLLVYNSNDVEELYFPGNSKVITNKVFSRVNRVSVSSGFRSPAGSLIGTIRIDPTSQPSVGLSYSSDYKFTAPIEGERLTVRYNLNRLISDVTVNLENVRCITADVLVKEAPILYVDVRGEIIVNNDFTSESNTVIENSLNSVVNLLNSSTLGSTIDYSDIINSVTSISGVDSVNISLFNESGSVGRRTYIKALNNQSIAAGDVRITAVSRKDFKIT
jgi:uncharacterized phage protein gp47/JayE